MSKKLRYVPMPGNRIGQGELELNPSSPEWHPDNLNKTCELCEKKFTFLNRRHHCRNCGRVVCDKCLIEYSRSGESHFIPVCKLCFNCAISGNKDDDTCVDYMRESNLTYEQFIPEDFSFNGVKVNTNDTLTISFNMRRYIIEALVISVENDNKPESSDFTDLNMGGPKINLQVITSPSYYTYLKPYQEFYLVNVNDNSKHILAKRKSDHDSLGYVELLDVKKYTQVGGYKYSKRKSKRSVRRRVSKRSNVRCKKVTKRLRKMRRRMRR